MTRALRAGAALVAVLVCSGPALPATATVAATGTARSLVERVDAPERPGKPVAEQTGPKAATLTWAASAGARKYKVQIRQDGGSWFAAGTVTTTEAQFYDIGADHVFKFRVAGVNGAGRSPWATSDRFRLQQS